MYKYWLMLIAFCTVGATMSSTAFAHGGHGPIDPDMRVDNPIEAVETGFGRMGAARDVTRTVEIVIDENGRFPPTGISVAQGETVRFSLRNTSRKEQVFMLGTATAVQEYAAALAVSSLMIDDGMSSRQLGGGQSAELIWQFTMAGNFVLACLVPGRADAGMRGTIGVSAQH